MFKVKGGRLGIHPTSPSQPYFCILSSSSNLLLMGNEPNPGTLTFS